ncbi:MAG: hypothetical protein ACYCPT_11935 [Acidimicrobiales bacterium]
MADEDTTKPWHRYDANGELLYDMNWLDEADHVYGAPICKDELCPILNNLNDIESNIEQFNDHLFQFLHRASLAPLLCYLPLNNAHYCPDQIYQDNYNSILKSYVSDKISSKPICTDENCLIRKFIRYELNYKQTTRESVRLHIANNNHHFNMASDIIAEFPRVHSYYCN